MARKPDTADLDQSIDDLQRQIDACEREIMAWQRKQDQLQSELGDVRSLKFILEHEVTASSVFIPADYRGSGSPRKFAEWLQSVKPRKSYILRYGAIYELTDKHVIGKVTPINPQDF